MLLGSVGNRSALKPRTSIRVCCDCSGEISFQAAGGELAPRSVKQRLLSLQRSEQKAKECAVSDDVLKEAFSKEMTFEKRPE